MKVYYSHYFIFIFFIFILFISLFLYFFIVLGETILHNAILGGSLEVVKLCLRLGASMLLFLFFFFFFHLLFDSLIVHY